MKTDTSKLRYLVAYHHFHDEVLKQYDSTSKNSVQSKFPRTVSKDVGKRMNLLKADKIQDDSGDYLNVPNKTFVDVSTFLATTNIDNQLLQSQQNIRISPNLDVDDIVSVKQRLAYESLEAKVSLWFSQF